MLSGSATSKDGSFTQSAGQPRTDLTIDLVELADAIVVVTPEYNHAYPAPLEQAIDVQDLGLGGKDQRAAGAQDRQDLADEARRIACID